MIVAIDTLTGKALDWAVWSIVFRDCRTDDQLLAALSVFTPSTDGNQCMDLIQKYDVSLTVGNRMAHWGAAMRRLDKDEFVFAFGDTPHEAVCRVIVRAHQPNEHMHIPDGAFL